MAPVVQKTKKLLDAHKEELVQQEVVMEEAEEEDEEEEEEQEDEEAGAQVEAEGEAEEEEAEDEDAEEEEEEEEGEEEVEAHPEEDGRDELDTTPAEESLENVEDAMQNGNSVACAASAAGNGDRRENAVQDSSNGAAGGGKIFIGGVTWDTTTEMLTSHFKKYGEITDSVIMRNRSTGHPRGFGFVTFANPSVCDKVLKDSHVIDGRTVDVKLTVPREKMSAGTKGPKTKKIFVGGLTTSTTQEEFKNYFAKFGKVIEHQIMQDHSLGRSRGFGFVTFDSEQVVEDILAQGKMHELGGKQVEIKKAEPKQANQEPPTRYGGGGGYSAGRGGGVYSANAYGGYNGGDTYYGGRGGYHSRDGERAGGYNYGGPFGYGGAYGGSYGYSDIDDSYGGLGYNYASYGPGSGYGGGSHGYGGGSHGRYHPYGR